MASDAYSCSSNDDASEGSAGSECINDDNLVPKIAACDVIPEGSAYLSVSKGDRVLAWRLPKDGYVFCLRTEVFDRHAQKLFYEAAVEFFMTGFHGGRVAGWLPLDALNLIVTAEPADDSDDESSMFVGRVLTWHAQRGCGTFEYEDPLQGNNRVPAYCGDFQEPPGGEAWQNWDLQAGDTVKFEVVLNSEGFRATRCRWDPTLRVRPKRDDDAASRRLRAADAQSTSRGISIWTVNNPPPAVESALRCLASPLLAEPPNSDDTLQAGRWLQEHVLLQDHARCAKARLAGKLKDERFRTSLSSFVDKAAKFHEKALEEHLEECFKESALKDELACTLDQSEGDVHSDIIASYGKCLRHMFAGKISGCLRPNDLLQMHRSLEGVLSGEGRWRATYAPPASGSNSTFADPVYVPRVVGMFCTALQGVIELYPDVSPAAKAAWVWYWFTTIRPFDDGNRRMARLVTNWVLARSGVPFPCRLRSLPEGSYRTCNQDANCSSTLSDLAEVVVKELHQSLAKLRKSAAQKCAAAKEGEKSRIVRSSRERLRQGACANCDRPEPTLLMICCGSPVHFSCLYDSLLATPVVCPVCHMQTFDIETELESMPREAPDTLQGDDLSDISDIIMDMFLPGLDD